MALFSITRYMGDDEDEKATSSKNDILKKIHKKAQQRAKEKKPDINKSTDSPHPDVDTTESSPLSLKTAKKRQREVHDAARGVLLSGSTVSVTDNDDNVHEIPKEASSPSGSVKKKKKKTRNSPDEHTLDRSSADGILNCDTEKKDFQSPSKSAKKRKRKQSLETSVSDTGACVSSTNDDDDVHSPSVSPKRKKKKQSESDTDVVNKKPLDSSHQITASNSIDESASALLKDISKSLSGTGKKKKKKKSKNNEQLTENLVQEPKKTKLNAESDPIMDGEMDEGIEVDEEDEEEIEKEDEPKNRKRKSQQAHTEVGGFTVIGQVKTKAKEKVERVLPDWLAQPSVVHGNIMTNRIPLSAISQLDKDLIEKLQANDIIDFFPVQGHVIPAILGSVHPHSSHTLAVAGYQPYDICCSAPTGSGKTLAYVLPLVQVLKARLVRRVRVLVILPVRDLAAQVHRVFKTYCTGTKLEVGLAAGQTAFSKEQESLVKKSHSGWESMVDIVVATPSRIMKHITDTPGFDLSVLRFLVIDEADRLMEEAKYDWLTQVESAVYNPPSSVTNQRIRPTELTVENASMMSASIPLQKLLFSATLSQNPEKLQQMRLFQPRLYTAVVEDKNVLEKTSLDKTNPESSGEVHCGTSEPVRGDFIGKYTTPPGLTEYMVKTSLNEKPLVLLYLLHTRKMRRVLCFTKSLTVTRNLYWLVKLVGGINVMEFSSSLKTKKRMEILKKFTNGKLDMLICTDALARGMDVENVQYVISYDVPPYLKTYIHRVGRTARGGREGSAVTLLDTKDVSFFKRMLREGGKTGLKEEVIDNDQLEPYVEDYKKALSKMPDVLKTERKKSLKN